MIKTNYNMKKKICYIDMDGVLCDFYGAIEKHPDKDKYTKSTYDMIPGIFDNLDPLPGAIEAFEYLFDAFDVYILSTPPWRNPDAWVHKKEWIEKYIPKAKRRLILSHHKNLAKGDYLIDDTWFRGQKDFEGEWLHFGSYKYPDWKSVVQYLNTKVGDSQTQAYNENAMEEKEQNIHERNPDTGEIRTRKINRYNDNGEYILDN